MMEKGGSRGDGCGVGCGFGAYVAWCSWEGCCIMGSPCYRPVHRMLVIQGGGIPQLGGMLYREIYIDRKETAKLSVHAATST